MRNPTHAGRKPAAALAVVLAVAGIARTASAADAARKVTRVDVVGEGSEATVLVRGWHVPAFSVFRLDDPQRVIVDLKDADVTALVKTGAVAGRGPVVSVTARQFDDPKTSVGRLVIAVKTGARYDVGVVGDDLAVSVRVDESAPKAVASATPAVSPAPVAAASPVPATVPTVTTPMGENVVQISEDRLPGDVTGGTRLVEARLTGSGDHGTLLLKADGPVSGYQVVELKSPGRLAIDLEGFVHSVRPSRTSAGPVVNLRLARHDDRVRVVLEAAGDRFPTFALKRTASGLTVSFGSAPVAPVVASAPAAPAITATVATATAAAPVNPPAPAVSTRSSFIPAEVKSLDVSGRGRTTRVVLAMTAPVETSEQTLADGSRMLILKNARLPKELNRRLDTSALEGPLVSVASYQDNSDGSVRLVAFMRTTEPDVTDHLTPLQVGPSYGLSWQFAGNGTRRITLAAASNAPGGFMGEAPVYAQNAGPRATGYIGKRVDFTAKDLDILQFLQAIGEIAKKNIVASDDVNGKITIRLRNVPWDEALEIVLKTKGLVRQDIAGGSIIRVLPADRARKEQDDEAAALKIAEMTGVLKIRLVPVNFAPADTMALKVKELLSPRGSVTVDDRTNVLIVKDLQDYLAKVELLVRTLDTQTPQVLIEARIVEASTTFNRSFGIQWGGNAIASPAQGTPTGLVFPNTVAVSGVSNDGPISGVSATPNFVVNFPTAVGQSTGAGLGFIFGSAGGAQTLNLRLTAAELGGVVKTVSAPKAVTLDNLPATIGQGLQIPYNVVSAAGANTAFIQARLQLAVTPHVTADGSVLMRINVSNNQPNTGVTGANGQPSIQTREANTNVLVKDGDTTVIGGIYTRSTSKTDNSVPFLGQIPILGALFSHSVDEDDRDEMLIFITPRIINRQQSVITNNDSLSPVVPGAAPAVTP